MKKFLITLLMLIFSSSIVNAKEQINIAYTIDNNYPLYTLLSINSILVNNKSDSDYKFYIIEDNITDKNKKFMKKYIEKHNQKIEFIHIDMNTITKGEKFYTGTITPIALARIVIPEIFPHDIHKVLYLDADTLVVSDIKELYDIDITGYLAGMVLDVGSKDYGKGIGTKSAINGQYFNSGMILMDIDGWRKNNISRKMVNTVHEQAKTLKSRSLTDQDVINIVLENKIKQLPYVWNNQMWSRPNDFAIYDKGMIHYIYGHCKPWLTYKTDTPVFYMYYKYWNNSDLRFYKYIDLSRRLYKKLWIKNLPSYLKFVKENRYYPEGFSAYYLL